MKHMTIIESLRLKCLLPMGLVIAGAGYAAFADHPPYPDTFSIEWDEEVQVAEGQSIWVHRSEIYRRRSIWTRWDAKKLTEELRFSLDKDGISFSYRLPKGVFRGIERIGSGIVIEYAEDTRYPSIGSCAPGEGVECYVVVKPDGSIYRPRNRAEILDKFGSLSSCRTPINECYAYFDRKRISLEQKKAYFQANPRFGDEESPTRGHQLKEQELQ